MIFWIPIFIGISSKCPILRFNEKLFHWKETGCSSFKSPKIEFIEYPYKTEVISVINSYCLQTHFSSFTTLLIQKPYLQQTSH